MRDWLVGGAVIEGPEGLLLVRNLRRDGTLDWSPPGGVIDEGEELLSGLTREVEEETGLVVTGWLGPLYEIVVEAPGLGWRLRVEAWRARAYTGALQVGADPDGIVVDAAFVPCPDTPALLSAVHPWVREPLCDWLDERWEAARRYRYGIEGADRSTMVVSRVHHG